MIITINTKEDRPEDIRKAISFLQTFLSDTTQNIESTSPDLFNLFNDSSSSAPHLTQQEKNKEYQNEKSQTEEDSDHFADRFEVY